MSRTFLRFAQTAIALGLIALLLRGASPEVLWAMRGQIDFARWGTAALLLLLMYALGAASLVVLMATGPGVAWLRLAMAYGYVQAIALFTPAQAGEALLPSLFGRAGVDTGQAAAALVVQRLVTLGITAAAAALFAAAWLPPVALPLLAVATLLAMAALISAVRSRRLRARLPRLGAFLERVDRAGQRIAREHKVGLAVHIAVMIVRYAVATAASWVMLASFGIDISFLEVAGLSGVATLAAVLPLSPAGLGVIEGIWVAALRPRGYAIEQILGASLAGRLITVVLLGTFALIYSATRWKDPRHDDGHDGHA
jgi:uncharacterized membrane protein YbhN (UPF0104 family)